jgi:alkylation response protein AidB-like acyl-CoA dehydrogenase
MNLQMTADQVLLRETARKIAESEFRPKACKWDGAYPEENEKFLREQGLIGVSLPEEYGGGGLTLADEAMVIEEIGRVCPDTAMLMTLVGPPRIIAELGSEAVKRKYLPGFCNEGRKIAICISEPEAGSAMNEMRTSATPKDGKLVVSGEKVFISHAEVCVAFLVFVRYEEGIGALVIDRDTPGVQIGKPEPTMAGYPLFSVLFDKCEVPEENVVVRGKGSFQRLMMAFNNERCLSASWAVATALCAMDLALEYTQQRKQFGRKIADFQGIQWKLADMAVQIESARLLTLQATSDPSRVNASMAKVAACEMVEKVTSEALQIFGGTGYLKPHPMEFLYRLARGRKIAGGTVEMQRNSIAGEILRHGLHRA